MRLGRLGVAASSGKGLEIRHLIIQALDPRRPVVGEGVFDACATDKTCPGGILGAEGGNGKRGRNRRFHIGQAKTAGDIEQCPVHGVAETAYMP